MSEYEKLKSKILYLAMPWKFNPEQSFKNAKLWTRQLLFRGFFPFSPIVHSHPIWEEIKDLDCSGYEMNPEWEGMNGLGYIAGKKPCPIECYIDRKEICETPKCPYFGKELVNWLDWDTRLMKGCMKGDGGPTPYWKCSTCETKYSNYVAICCKKITDMYSGIEYDSKFAIAMHDSAIHKDVEDINREYQQYIKDPVLYGFQISEHVCLGWNDLWESQGCRIEYEFGKANFIQVVDLKSLLQGIIKNV